MKPYQQWLKDKGIKQSFSRKGNCMDNSLMENFFGIMKNEMYYGYRFKTRTELVKAMEEYITYYNTERINANRVEPQNQNKGALSHHHIVPFGNGRFG